MPRRLTTTLAAALLCAAAVGRAQPAIASLLPETTVLALHVSPDGVDTTTLEALLADLELDRAADAARQLAALFADVADVAEEPGEQDLLAELAAVCPEAAAAVEDGGGVFGPTVVGVTLSRFDPVPGVVAATRPPQPGLAERLVAAVAACFGSGSLGFEGDAEIHLLLDASDLPLVIAAADGFVVLATDPDDLRGALRRAQGAREPSLLTTRVGSLSRGLTSRGLGVTLNLAAAADGLALYRGLLGEAPEAGPLLDRFLTTLEIVGGFAWHATVDAGGVVVESVAAFDARRAEEAGEHELLALLTCDGCRLSEPALVPRDAVALSGGAFSARAFVAWLDTWFADLARAGLLDDDLRGAWRSLTGVDLDEALLDWVGGSWHSATLDVLATDLRAWVQGPPSVATVAVTSEAAAERGIELLLEAFANVYDAIDAFAAAMGAETSLSVDDVVSVRQRSYRGVDYLRVRSGPSVDVGVAVFGGHLVVGSPPASLHAAIDVHLGAPPAAGVVWRTYESLGLVGGDVVAYDLTDAPAFLRGLARATDLAAGTVATLARAAAVVAADRAEDSDGVGVDPDAVPTYDDLLGLVDLFTEALELVADRTGVAVGTTEVVDGAAWTTWRLPLR